MAEISKCCKDENNLEVMKKTPDPFTGTVLIVRKCKVCNKFHYELDAPPIQIGLSSK
jgi:hypothetical protein